MIIEPEKREYLIAVVRRIARARAELDDAMGELEEIAECELALDDAASDLPHALDLTDDQAIAWLETIEEE